MESIFKLSVIVGMIDHLTSPMRNVGNNVTGGVQRMTQAFAGMTKYGVAMAGMGAKITEGVLSPVRATFETKKALGELKSVGIEDLQGLEKASKQFSDTWAGTTKAEFISAAYDIKSGIASLSDESVAKYTEIAGITAKGTKASIAEMTSLFATGYGIYKDFYKDMSDIDFGEMFAAGIGHAANIFKTDGKNMAESISTLGAAATSAKVPMEEQFAILGMLQATMSGSEAGTKYKAFLQSAASAGQELGLKFTDTNNQLLSLPQILDLLRGKFGDTVDAAEKMQLQKAFGTDEAVAMVDLLYNKTGDLQSGILSVYDSMGKGTEEVRGMASAINETEPDKYVKLQQQVHNIVEEIGNQMLPTINNMLSKGSEICSFINSWIGNNQELTGKIALVVLGISLFLTAAGTTMTVIGGLGLVITKTISTFQLLGTGVKVIGDSFLTLRIKAMYAGDAMNAAFLKMKTGAATAGTAIKGAATSVLTFAKTAAINGVTAVKNFVISMATMAKQAITTAITAMPGLIASVWSFTAALLANPITWVVIAIVALIAAIVLLWQNWDSVVAWIQSAWASFVNGIVEGFNWIVNLFSGMPVWLQIAIAAFAPFIGIPLLIYSNWDSIVSFFSGLWTSVGDAFSSGISNIQNFLDSTLTWFANSGAKVISTFVDGIRSMINTPAEVVQEGLAKVRQLLPFSDAKKGPLSTLTLSGKRVFETINTGMKKTKDLPAQTTFDAFSMMNMSPEMPDLNISSEGIVNDEVPNGGLKEIIREKSEADGAGSSSTQNNKKTEIHIHCDFSKLKSLDALIKFAKEIEEYVNGNKNNDESDMDGDFVFDL